MNPGGIVIAGIRDLGRFTLFTMDSVAWVFRGPFRWRLFVDEIEFVGNQSLFIVGLTGASTGAVFAFQMWLALEMVGTDTMTVGMVCLSLVRELAPIFTGIVVAGRAGAAMAAKIGIMRVTDQIDAMEVMAVVPKQYLVAPKIVAATLATPLLTALFSLVGTVSGYLIAVFVCHVDPGVSINQMLYYTAPWDFFHGIIKSAVFGLLLGAIGCYKGYRAKNGAEGVGTATNEAVVYSIVSILVLDYFLSVLLPNGIRVVK